MQLSATVFIIAITSLVSFLAFSNTKLFDELKFNAWFIREKKQAWRFITCGFLHADFIHLFFNMFVLYNFGRIIESFFIARYPHEFWKAELIYVLFYVSAIAVSNIYSFEKHKDDLFYNAVGASGAVSAIVFAFIILMPFESLYLMFIPVPIPAAIFGILYLIYSAYMSKKGTDNIGHDAHFFGALYGILFLFIIEPTLFRKFIDQILAKF